MTRDFRGSCWWLIPLGLAAEGAWLGLIALGDLRFAIPGLVISILAISAVHLIALRLCLNGRVGRRGVILILVFALLFRFTLLFSPPTLSDDVYRYLWEGRVILNQENPFALAPSDPRLEELHDEYHEQINFPDMTTIYPPVAQVAFAASQLLTHRPWGFKLLAIVADMILLLALIGILARRGVRPGWILVYAWHPLPILEFAGSGHIDVVAIGFLWFGFFLLGDNRRWGAIGAVVLSGLTKFFGFALIPAFSRRTGWLMAALMTTPIVIAAYLPFLGAGAGVLDSMREYASRWYFNGSCFPILEAMLGSSIAARILVIVVFGATAVLYPLKQEDQIRVGFVLVGLFILLSPTVHPWYVVWVIPFLCVFPNPAWFYLSYAVVLSYTVLTRYASTGVWREDVWVRWVEYAPFAVILVAPHALNWYRRRQR